MGRPRSDIAQSAAERLEKALKKSAPRALVGFDGFVDTIIRVVDTRRTMDAAGFDAIATIPAFAARIGSAAGKSSNIELVVEDRRFGGNGPLLASAVGSLGGRVTYIGGVGCEDEHTRLDPIYQAFADRCERVYPIAPPAQTDALEFEDGKVMMGKTANAQVPTWALIKELIGLDEVRSIVEGSRLIGMVNWVMMGGVEGIWRGLIDDVLSGMTRDASARRVYLDLSDPAKRTDEDIRRALSIVVQLDERCPVTLGLNLAESQRIARVSGARAYDDAGNAPMSVAVRETAESIREALGIECVVVHPRQGAAAADAGGASAWFDGPFTSAPRLSTGAGDHFNGGFALAQAVGLALDECLGVGCGVSGAYVRDAQSPTLNRLCGFLRDLPDPE